MSVVVVGEEPGVIERVSTNGTDPEGPGVTALTEAHADKTSVKKRSGVMNWRTIKDNP